MYCERDRMTALGRVLMILVLGLWGLSGCGGHKDKHEDDADTDREEVSEEEEEEGGVALEDRDKPREEGEKEPAQDVELVEGDGDGPSEFIKGIAAEAGECFEGKLLQTAEVQASALSFKVGELFKDESYTLELLQQSNALELTFQSQDDGEEAEAEGAEGEEDAPRSSSVQGPIGLTAFHPTEDAKGVLVDVDAEDHEILVSDIQAFKYIYKGFYRVTFAQEQSTRFYLDLVEGRLALHKYLPRALDFKFDVNGKTYFATEGEAFFQIDIKNISRSQVGDDAVSFDFEIEVIYDMPESQEGDVAQKNQAACGAEAEVEEEAEEEGGAEAADTEEVEEQEQQEESEERVQEEEQGPADDAEADDVEGEGVQEGEDDQEQSPQEEDESEGPTESADPTGSQQSEGPSVLEEIDLEALEGVFESDEENGEGDGEPQSEEALS